MAREHPVDDLLRPRPVRRRLRNRRQVDGLISVVVPVFDVATYVGQAIASVLDQEGVELEVLVVDDGSTDGTLDVVRRISRADPRVRLLRQKHAGPNAARNLALASARGEFLAFLDGDDLLLPGAYRDLMTSLATSGSDFAIGGYHRFNEDDARPAGRWIVALHAEQHQAVDVVTVPDAMVNVVAWSKLYRRSFWDEHVRSFAVGGFYQDQLVAARSYALATSFDVLDREVVAWRSRDDGSSMTQQLGDVANMRDRFRTGREGVRIYEALRGQGVAGERLVQLLNFDIWHTVKTVDRRSPEYFSALVEQLRALVDDVRDPDLWDLVGVSQKVLYQLVVAGRRADALEFLETGGQLFVDKKWSVEDEKVMVHLPFWEDPDLPRWAFRAKPAQAVALRRRRGRAVRAARARAAAAAAAEAEEASESTQA
ncbi:MAG: hypothetical protein JWQ74_1212 [Marmoricola sp.]|nr:hypothetical protein [Marmoricola sp.]